LLFLILHPFLFLFLFLSHPQLNPNPRLLNPNRL
jgi:hypothetical protein